MMSNYNGSYDKSQRSVFVGNISYDVTEDQIKTVFAQCGQIVHFRLVHDRDTGRPKGFGFCEFNDIPSAERAIQRFNGYELNGRPLRVDSAAGSDRNTEEAHMAAVQQAQQAVREQPIIRVAEENPYGKEVDASKATEAIAKTVAAMPPEQMFELMKQMKQTVTTNPAQTRHLLMENPQLAYALLQAQVVMRVVDPKVAYSMLHRDVPATREPFHQHPSVTNGAPNAPPFGGQFRPPGPAGSGGFAMPPGPRPGFPPHFNGPPPFSGAPTGPPPQQQPFPRPPHPTAPASAGPISRPSAAAAAAAMGVAADDEASQAQMLIKVIQLTDEQINLLPADDRAKVLELRNQLRNQMS